MTAHGDDAIPRMDPDRDATRNAWTARAAAYAEYAVPKNRPFARRLIELLAPNPGERVLDVATGPGVVAVEAARAMAGEGDVLATDIAPVWDSWVADAARHAGVENIAFATMPADALGLPDDWFDVVACQFGLMFVTEPSAALAEMKRVLKPGGRLGVAVWSTLDRVAHFVPAVALRDLFPTDSATNERTPLSLSEPGLIERLVADAGFTDVHSERRTETFLLDDFEQEWQRRAGDPAFSAQIAASDDNRVRAREVVREALERFRVGDRWELPSEAIIVTAAKPVPEEVCGGHEKVLR